MTKYERCWFTASDKAVYQVFFRADEQLALVALLTLSPLRTKDFVAGAGSLSVIDYGIRWPEDGIALVSLSDTCPEWLVGMDSFVQLYRDEEREARWIPQVKRLLRRRRVT